MMTEQIFTLKQFLPAANAAMPGHNAGTMAFHNALTDFFQQTGGNPLYIHAINGGSSRRLLGAALRIYLAHCDDDYLALSACELTDECKRYRNLGQASAFEDQIISKKLWAITDIDEIFSSACAMEIMARLVSLANKCGNKIIVSAHHLPDTAGIDSPFHFDETFNVIEYSEFEPGEGLQPVSTLLKLAIDRLNEIASSQCQHDLSPSNHREAAAITLSVINLPCTALVVFTHHPIDFMLALLERMSGLDLGATALPGMTDEQWEKLLTAIETLQGTRLYVLLQNTSQTICYDDLLDCLKSTYQSYPTHAVIELKPDELQAQDLLEIFSQRAIEVIPVSVTGT